ncbi:MAG: TonB-dependent receptor, partial [Cryomorphaceae bacterium]|nr:TonB-dependent receptor [Cryomorphaceae bacterium]
MKNTTLLTVLLLLPMLVLAQTGKVSGRVFNALNNEPLPFAKVIVVDQQKGAVTLEDGTFEIVGLTPGIYNFRASVSGFQDLIINEVTVTNARTVELNFPLEMMVVDKEEVIAKASPFVRKDESPVSLKTLNATEVERLPGANRDVSKVLQALPGVAARATFRNDIIIRGGAPGENKFYLDGIEVPNINHFATQGSSGGPVGLLNVN